MDNSERQLQLCADILAWYDINKRDLPWRKKRTGYRILVSEVMLQQTQVDRVIPKYREFLRTFPSAKQLAAASKADVIRVWKGLGYNRRALYLQRSAKTVCEAYGGRFPKDIDALKALPGIGDYTARAVLSFAYDVPVAVLDTNHRQFYQRAFFGKKQQRDSVLLETAEALVRWIEKEYGRARVHDWNQALMDFMSAVVSQNSDPLVVAFRAHYPAAQKKKKKRRKTIPFRETDRFFRGRIIDILRDDRGVAVLQLRQQFHEISDERFYVIVRGLERDGLIVQEKQRILLPK